MSRSPPPGTREKIPRGVWALGFVSLFMDISSEMIHALLPVYLVSVLGASTMTVGFIEGMAEATAMITKVFSGVLSDWLGRRKLLAAIGYGLAAFTKPIFPLAGSIGWVVAARFIDRVGKGIRGAPRDALVADLSPPHLRGASYGLRQSLDTVGAFTGPLIAIALMSLTANNFKVVFWFAVLPAFISLALIVFAVKEPPGRGAPEARRVPGLARWRTLPRAYWMVVGVGTMLTLARFSEAFLVLRARDVGVAMGFVPALLVVMNIAYALSAYPAGLLSDRLGRMSPVFVGVLILIAADLVLAFGRTTPAILVGTALWGLHMGLTQGLLTSLVADTAPEDLRGTAFGMFNLAAGAATLLASLIAGGLWEVFGAQATFLAGAMFTLIALVGMAIVRERQS